MASVTIHDVAALAGVSTKTVSRVLASAGRLLDFALVVRGSTGPAPQSDMA